MSEQILESKRFCLSCRQSLRGVCSGRCPECGKAFNPDDLRTTSSHPHLDRWMFIAGFVRSVLVATGILTGISFARSLLVWYGFDEPLWWLFSFAMAPLLVLLLVAIAFPAVPVSRRLRVFGIIIPILYISITWTHWPLWITFWTHKPFLERVAQQAQEGAAVASPDSVGFFDFSRVRVIEAGNVGFQLNGGSGGGVYLVRRDPDSSRVWYNTNWEISLGDEWYLVYED